MTPEQKAALDRDIAELVGVPQEASGLGGAFEGAARFDRQIATWNPGIRSADADILPDKTLLDARARDLWRNDAFIQSGVNQHKDSIVGSMYLLNAKPMWKVLGKPEGWDEEFQEEVESLFSIWSESPKHWPDASGQLTFTDMVRLAVGIMVFGGEVLMTSEWMKKRGRDFRTAFQFVDTDRLSTPPEFTSDDMIRGGIRHDRYGRHMSAFIRTRHPFEYRSTMGNTPWWREVPMEKPWGRTMVVYLREINRAAQTRAVSQLTAGLREIAITRKFRDVTLQNAVLNASYAATIESELPTEVVFQQLGAGADYTEAITNYGSSYLASVMQYASGSKNLQMDGAKIPHLFPGTRLQLRPAGTPGGVGQDFEVSLLRYAAALMDLSYEEFSRDYTKTNYSSARAAMLSTWRAMQAKKRVAADGVANAIYRNWLEEAIQNDRLSTFRASESDMLYTDNYQNLMFDALANATWLGAARGQIDELKETQAAVLRMKYGLTTGEDELARLGKDWRQVYQQQSREKKMRKELDIEWSEDAKMMNAATGSPRENDDNAGDDGNDDPAAE